MRPTVADATKVLKVFMRISGCAKSNDWFIFSTMAVRILNK